jgi:hypothetical protein
VAWMLFPGITTPIKWSIKWFFSSSRYKSQVLTLPPPVDGYLKHVEWDGWGFLNHTYEYLVLDPSNGLAAGAASGKPGKFPGLPCEVYEVRKLDSSWYLVGFYTDYDWDRCPVELRIPPTDTSRSPRAPNTRLKLPAPVLSGRIPFVNTPARRRSLSAIR